MEKKKKVELNSKTKYGIIGGIVLLLIVILSVVACTRMGSEDARKFKAEYEEYNGQKTESGNVYQTIKLSGKNKVKYTTMEEAVDIIENGTGIIYFGMPDCPWCRNLVPILVDKLNCSCLDNFYYVDMSDARNTYEIQDDSVVETKKAEKAYYTLLELLDEHLDNYRVDDENGIENVLEQKRIYLPMVVAVKDGKVVDAHTGTVNLVGGQTAYDELSAVQKSEVEVILNNMIDAVTKEETTCNGHC